MIEDEVLNGELVPIKTHLHLDDFGTFYAVYPHHILIKPSFQPDTLKNIVGEEQPVWEQGIPGFDSVCMVIVQRSHRPKVQSGLLIDRRFQFSPNLNLNSYLK
ncbi:hypothetical protein O9992_15125 [Vibrio lentus]|nr:hypothetical protein [Vibrio lentus]